MNTKWVIVAILLVLVLGGGAFLFLNNNKSAPAETNQTPNESVNQTETQATLEPTEASAKEANVTLTSTGFSPKSLTIDKGTKVIWTNESGQTATVNSDPHPTHTAYPPLNLGSFSDGEGIELVFNEAGTFSYHNHFDATVRGTIIVK